MKILNYNIVLKPYGDVFWNMALSLLFIGVVWFWYWFFVVAQRPTYRYVKVKSCRSIALTDSEKRFLASLQLKQDRTKL